MARLTPRDIQEKEFSSGFRGYKEEEVDEFLDRITSSYEEVFKENIDFKEEVERLSEENKKYELIGERMQAALVAAQETADDVRKNATKEAENILREAEIKAHKMVQESRDQHRELQKSLAIVKQIEEEYRFKLKSTLQSYLKLLDEVAIGDNKDVKRWILPEDMAALGERRREMEEREAAPKVAKTPPVAAPPAKKEEPKTEAQKEEAEKVEEKKPEDTAPMVKPSAAEAPVIAEAAAGKPEGKTGTTQPPTDKAKLDEPKKAEPKAEEKKDEDKAAAEKAEKEAADKAEKEAAEKEAAEKASKEAAEKAAVIAAEAEKAAAQKSEAEKKAAQLLDEIAAQAAEEKKTEEVKEAQKAIAEKVEDKKSGTTQPPAKAAEAQRAQGEKVPFDQEAGKASAVSAEWANLQQAVDEAVKATDKPTQAEKEAKSAESTMPGEMIEAKPAAPAVADKPIEQPKKAPEATETKAKAKDEIKEEKTGKSALEDIEIVEDESFWKDI